MLMYLAADVKLPPTLNLYTSWKCVTRQHYHGYLMIIRNKLRMNTVAHVLFPCFQAGTDEEYERWVKTLAVELMRQTPLESVRFLDILGITATIATARGYEDDTGCIRRGPSKNNDVSFRNSRKDCLRREDCHPQDDTRLKDFITNYERGRTKQRVWVNNFVSECVEKRPVRAQSSDPVHKMSDSESELEDADEKEMMALLRRCQQVDSYVPVRDKRRLFESLCQRGRRLAQSSDNLCSAAGIAEVKLRRRKRARSLHDLSRSNVAVREICQYFETRVQLEQDVTPHQAVVRLHQQ
jgi:hypothetical protein